MSKRETTEAAFASMTARQLFEAEVYFGYKEDISLYIMKNDPDHGQLLFKDDRFLGKVIEITEYSFTYSVRVFGRKHEGVTLFRNLKFIKPIMRREART